MLQFVNSYRRSLANFKGGEVQTFVSHVLLFLYPNFQHMHRKAGCHSTWNEIAEVAALTPYFHSKLSLRFYVNVC